MSKRNFSGENRDLVQLAEDAKSWFLKNDYDTQLADSSPKGPWVIQARKTSSVRTLLGTNQAFTVKIEGSPQEYSVEVTIGKWVENLTGAGISGLFTGGLTWVTAGIAAAWAVKLEADFWDWLTQRNVFGKGAGTPPAVRLVQAPTSGTNRWYYTTDGQTLNGPVPFEQLQTIAASKQLQGSNLVWQEGTTGWIPTSEVPGLMPAPPPPLPVVTPAPPPLPGMTAKMSAASALASANQWDYTLDGKSTQGPVSFEELQSLATEGKLHPTHRVKQESTFQWILASDVPGLFAPAAPKPALSVNLADQLKKLAELRDLGILSQEEFDAKKKDILSRM